MIKTKAEPNALEYHIWLCAKLHGIIAKDKELAKAIAERDAERER